MFPVIRHVVKCFPDKIWQHFCIFISKYSKNQQLFFDKKLITKWLKDFQWMNNRAGKGFFKEKMANLKVFIAKLCKTYRRQHFIHENS